MSKTRQWHRERRVLTVADLAGAHHELQRVGDLEHPGGDAPRLFQQLPGCFLHGAHGGDDGAGGEGPVSRGEAPVSPACTLTAS